MMFHTTNLSSPLVWAVCCPISRKPFNNAQTANCGERHTFSMESAIKTFGELNRSQLCKLPAPCPLCADKVTAYAPNPALQKLVDAILKTGCEEVEISERMLALDDGPRYPLDKTTYQTAAALYRENYIELSLQEVSPNPTNKTIKNISLIIEIQKEGPAFKAVLHFDKSDLTSKSEMIEFLNKQKVAYSTIASLQGVDEHHFDMFYFYANKRAFLSFLVHFVLQNEFDKVTQAQLRRLYGHIEAPSLPTSKL